MPRDRPEPIGPPHRRALDDLRERLARLPPGHPSAQDHSQQPAQPTGPGQPTGPARATGPAQAGEHQRGKAGRGDAARDRAQAGDEHAGAAPSLARGIPGGGRPVGQDKPSLEERLARLDRLTRAARPGPGDGNGRASGAGGWRRRTGGVPLARSRETYRPWFCAGEPGLPWFSEDPGDRSR